jgi:hypothetical protein
VRASAICALAVVGIAALALAGCGGNDNGDGDAELRDDPEAVVNAYIRARADCGAAAARRTYDLVTAVRGGASREEYVEGVLRDERANGCTPERVGELSTFIESRGEDQAVVEVRKTGGAEGDSRQRVRVLRTDDGWKVDTGVGG